MAAAAQLNVTRRYLTAVIGVGFIALIVYMYLDTRLWFSSLTSPAE